MTVVNLIDGVAVDGNGTAFVCHIRDFTDELKQEIKNRLSEICHGKDNASTERMMYTYRETLKEFIRRYNKKSENIKKGMIGELLTHLVISKILPYTESANPYFNMEESSIKKGFDLVLFNNSRQDILITEVKSGNAKDKKTDEKNINLLNTAKNDLHSRLNGSETNVWVNAINGAKIALSNGEVKDRINEILDACYVQAGDEKQDPKTRDVIIVSVVYESIDYPATLYATNKKKESVEKEKIFRSVIAICLQKETYVKVADFLNEESEQ